MTLRGKLARIIVALALAMLGAITGAAAQDGKAAWQKTVEAANAEGTVLFYSQPNQAARDFILREFPKAYPNIKVSLSVMDGAGFIGRVRTERGAGKFLWDMALAGPPVGYALAHDGSLDPVLPEFVDPEVNNPDAWGGWANAFNTRA